MGSCAAATGVSLKPTTATSAPASSPCARTAPNAPIAVKSLTAKIAVIRRPGAQQFVGGFAATADVERRVDDRFVHDFVARICVGFDEIRGCGPDLCWRKEYSGKHTHTTMPAFKQVLCLGHAAAERRRRTYTLG